MDNANAEQFDLPNPPDPPCEEEHGTGQTTIDVGTTPLSVVPGSDASQGLSNWGPLPTGISIENTHSPFEVSETMREMREAEKWVKAARLKMREWKKETMKSSGKRAEKKRLEEQFVRRLVRAIPEAQLLVSHIR
jgi:hypothetical protein